MRVQKAVLVTYVQKGSSLRRECTVHRRGSGTIISQLFPGLITKHKNQPPRPVSRDHNTFSVAKISCQLAMFKHTQTQCADMHHSVLL